LTELQHKFVSEGGKKPFIQSESAYLESAIDAVIISLVQIQDSNDCPRLNRTSLLTPNGESTVAQRSARSSTDLFIAQEG